MAELQSIDPDAKVLAKVRKFESGIVLIAGVGAIDQSAEEDQVEVNKQRAVDDNPLLTSTKSLKDIVQQVAPIFAPSIGTEPNLTRRAEGFADA